MITFDKAWNENTNLGLRKRRTTFTYDASSLTYFRNRCETYGYFVTEDFDNNVSNDIILEKVSSLDSDGVNKYLFGFHGSGLSFTYEECNTVLNYFKRLHKKLNKMNFFDIKYVTESAKYLLEFRSRDFADRIVEEYFVKGTRDLTDSLKEALIYYSATPEFYSAILARIPYVKEYISNFDPNNIADITDNRLTISLKLDLMSQMFDLLSKIYYIEKKVTLPSGKIIRVKTNDFFYLLIPYLKELEEIRENIQIKVDTMRDIRSVMTSVDYHYNDTYKYSKILLPLTAISTALKNIIRVTENHGFEYVLHAYPSINLVADTAGMVDRRTEEFLTDEWYKGNAISVRYTDYIPTRISHSCRVRLTSKLC